MASIPTGGIPIVIHGNGAWGTTGHATGSRHYIGDALDFHLEGFHDRTVKRTYVVAIALMEAWIADTGWKGGLGLYPHWNNQGFHMECRHNDYRFAYIGSTTITYEAAIAEAETLALYRKKNPNEKLWISD